MKIRRSGVKVVADMASSLCSVATYLPRRLRPIADRVGGGFKRGLSLVYPPVCAHCGTPLSDDGIHGMLCCECMSLLGPPRGTVCTRCGAITQPILITAEGCPRCRQRRLHFDTVLSLGVYDGDLRRAVLRMKRLAGESLSVAVGDFVYCQLGPRLRELQVDVLVPIPMHWTRRLMRGTNSPEVVAEMLGRKLGVPVARRLLVRRRQTMRQFGLAPRARFRNLRGAFRVRKGYHLHAAHVLLVDDVLTTGATCSEAAGVLRRAGAERVSVVVIARAEGLEAGSR